MSEKRYLISKLYREWYAANTLGDTVFDLNSPVIDSGFTTVLEVGEGEPATFVMQGEAGGNVPTRFLIPYQPVTTQSMVRAGARVFVVGTLLLFAGMAIFMLFYAPEMVIFFSLIGLALVLIFKAEAILLATGWFKE